MFHVPCYFEVFFVGFLNFFVIGDFKFNFTVFDLGNQFSLIQPEFHYLFLYLHSLNSDSIHLKSAITYLIIYFVIFLLLKRPIFCHFLNLVPNFQAYKKKNLAFFQF
uniref:Uncharacterized protein n=1 Tax=Cacopsylla melanoneura TaxID=428564 RepID=A0A8D8WD14_9HEMI